MDLPRKKTGSRIYYCNHNGAEKGTTISPGRPSLSSSKNFPTIPNFRPRFPNRQVPLIPRPDTLQQVRRYISIKYETNPRLLQKNKIRDSFEHISGTLNVAEYLGSLL